MGGRSEVFGNLCCRNDRQEERQGGVCVGGGGGSNVFVMSSEGVTERARPGGWPLCPSE